MAQKRAVVFDMDGTILNTVDDLRDSLNYALGQSGHRCDFTAAQVGSFFGSGAEVAVVRALCMEDGCPPEALERVGTPGDGTVARYFPASERVLSVFREWYPAHCENQTRPYPGICGVLETLRERGIKTAVVSNKLDRAVQALCEKHFPGLFDAALGEREPELLRALRERGVKIAVVSNKLDAAVRSLCKRHFPGLVDAALGEREPEVRRKPAPDMTLAALARMETAAGEAVYVGDSEIDLLSAKNTGMDCIAVTWGFRSRSFLQRHGAQVIVDDAASLLRTICTME